ncbi:unnamed protein product [Leptosia nina]|uniref:Uncharacterized protein n=1 Tax=Leptosia nina TaxID=320188 RepID=A0AAV1JDT4_9NEOP
MPTTSERSAAMIRNVRRGHFTEVNTRLSTLIRWQQYKGVIKRECSKPKSAKSRRGGVDTPSVLPWTCDVPASLLTPADLWTPSTPRRIASVN